MGLLSTTRNLVSRGATFGPNGSFALENRAAGGLGGSLIVSALVIAGFAFLVQTRFWGMNADTSWLITVIDRLHAGDRLYVDIIELNPPSSIWLYFVPVQLSYLTGISAEALVRLFTLTSCLAGILLTAWIMRAGRLLPAPGIAPFVCLSLLASTVLVGNAFAQRDHLGVVLLTPLLAMAAWRASAAGSHPALRHWLLAGLSGSVLAVIKPHYALVVLAAAAFVAIRRKDLRTLFLPEFLLAGGICIAYLGVFYLAYPAYFADLLPLLRETYLAFNWPLHQLAFYALPCAIGAAIALRQSRSDFANLLLIASAAAWVPFFMQGKGWAYHAYAATYLLTVALIVIICDPARARISAIGRSSVLMRVALVAIAIFVVHWRFFPDKTPPVSLAAEIREQVSSPTVGMMGGNIGAGHPLSRMIGGTWIEPYCSDWIATYAWRLSNRAGLAGDAARVKHFDAMRDGYFRAKLERLTRGRPQVLIVDAGDSLTTAMLEQHGFAALLSGYANIGAFGDLTVYRLRDPAATNAM